MKIEMTEMLKDVKAGSWIRMPVKDVKDGVIMAEVEKAEPCMCEIEVKEKPEVKPVMEMTMDELKEKMPKK